MVILVVTCAQSSTDVLLRSYSRRTLHETYSITSVLCVSEIMKLCVSIAATTDRSISRLVYIMKSSQVMIFPACCYLIMNILQYDSIGLLDAASFSVVAQTKVLTSALASRLILSRQLSHAQWRALLVLAAGVTLIVREEAMQNDVNTPRPGCSSPPMTLAQQLHPLKHHGAHAMTPSVTAAAAHPTVSAVDFSAMSYIRGILELLLQTVLSAIVGVYLERYLKRDASALSIWEVNIQLATWSALAYACLVTYTADATHPFAGWSWITVGVAAVAAAGGTLVALCLRYTDAVLKNLPVAVSVVIVSGFSAAVLGGATTYPTAVGAMLVALAILSYSAPESQVAAKPSSSTSEARTQRIRDFK